MTTPTLPRRGPTKLSIAERRLILGDRDFPGVVRYQHLIVHKSRSEDWERYLADLEQQWAPFLAKRTQRKLKKPARKPRRR
jgi:hypothetical protein